MDVDAPATVIFVQASPALAGAQKSLLRLMRALEKPWRPILLTGAEGWLGRAARAVKIPTVILRFPSTRSIVGRLIANRRFGTAAAAACGERILGPVVVHANDHIQSISALELARALGAPSIVTLRTSAMTRRDLFKYGCQRHTRIVAVGPELRDRVAGWWPAGEIVCIENGVAPDEIAAPPPAPAAFPASVIVPGAACPEKGWRDLVDALLILEESERGRQIEFALLGRGEEVEAAVGAARLRTFSVRHIGLEVEFGATVRGFAFAVHPSRSESFGMALMELLAAGVPTLATRTGVAKELIADRRLLCRPNDPADLAERLAALMDDPTPLAAATEAAQRVIRTRYLIGETAARYMDLYMEMLRR